MFYVDLYVIFAKKNDLRGCFVFTIMMCNTNSIL